MKKYIILIIGIVLSASVYGADAQKPDNYEKKTVQLAEKLVKCSKEGNYNKTYAALRDIQRYEFRLQKEELLDFYIDLHEAVDKACDKFGIDENGKAQMKPIIDSLFSDELKNSIQ